MADSFYRCWDSPVCYVVGRFDTTGWHEVCDTRNLEHALRSARRHAKEDGLDAYHVMAIWPNAERLLCTYRLSDSLELEMLDLGHLLEQLRMLVSE